MDRFAARQIAHLLATMEKFLATAHQPQCACMHQTQNFTAWRLRYCLAGILQNFTACREAFCGLLQLLGTYT